MQLERDFNARRPMLTHIAAAVKSEVKDLLEDEGFQVNLSQSVLTGKQFIGLVKKTPSQKPLIELTSQIHVRVVSNGTNDIESIRETIETHYQSVEEGWKADRSQLTLKFLIPPQAKPDGFRDRKDLPNQMQVSIAASQSAPRMTTDGDQIPNLALIMKGGGIKGLAYVGALDLLRDEYDFSWFVGTSAGAITAILLAAGYTVEELQEILEEKNFNDFFDAKWYQYPTNLMFKWGVHPAKAFTDWLDILLAEKLGKRTEVTLGDIQTKTGNRVTVYASQQRKRALVFDSTKEPTTLAAHAARCSMSIPFVFTPAKQNGKLVFDGGVQNNFPIGKLREDHGEVPFISLFLGTDSFEPIKESSLLQVLRDIVLGQGEDEDVDKFRMQTVVIDPRPISTLDFELSKEEKEYLLATGQIGAVKHLLKNGKEWTTKEELAGCEKTKEDLALKVSNIRRSRKRKKLLWRWVRRVSCVLAVAIIYYWIWPMVFPNKNAVLEDNIAPVVEQLDSLSHSQQLLLANSDLTYVRYKKVLEVWHDHIVDQVNPSPLSRRIDKLENSKVLRDIPVWFLQLVNSRIEHVLGLIKKAEEGDAVLLKKLQSYANLVENEAYKGICPDETSATDLNKLFRPASIKEANEQAIRTVDETLRVLGKAPHNGIWKFVTTLATSQRPLDQKSYSDFRHFSVDLFGMSQMKLAGDGLSYLVYPGDGILDYTEVKSAKLVGDRLIEQIKKKYDELDIPAKSGQIHAINELSDELLKNEKVWVTILRKNAESRDEQVLFVNSSIRLRESVDELLAPNSWDVEKSNPMVQRAKILFDKFVIERNRLLPLANCEVEAVTGRHPWNMKQRN